MPMLLDGYTDTLDGFSRFVLDGTDSLEICMGLAVHAESSSIVDDIDRFFAGSEAQHGQQGRG